MAFRFLALLFVALAAACTTTAGSQTEPSFYVVRHLHTPEGERDPDLLAEGRRQAILLADRLASSPPRAIYVSDYKRTSQTAAPLAGRLGLTPIVYDPADTPALAARVRNAAGPVLIVGHSNTVPDIVAALGGEKPAPLVHEDFGDVWTLFADGRTLRSKIAE